MSYARAALLCGLWSGSIVLASHIAQFYGPFVASPVLALVEAVKLVCAAVMLESARRSLQVPETRTIDAWQKLKLPLEADPEAGAGSWDSNEPLLSARRSGDDGSACALDQQLPTSFDQNGSKAKSRLSRASAKVVKATRAGGSTASGRPRLPSAWVMLLLPAVCWCLSNTLMLHALAELPPYTFALLSVLKLVAHALAGSWGGRQRLSGVLRLWVGLLGLGVAIGAGAVPQAVPISPEVPEVPGLPFAWVPGVMLMSGVALFSTIASASFESALAALLAAESVAEPDPRATSARGEVVVQAACVRLYALGAALNLGVFLVQGGSLGAPTAGMYPEHWLLVQLLVALGLATNSLLAAPAHCLLMRAYASTGALVAVAWMSKKLLHEAPPLAFSFGALWVMAATVLLHVARSPRLAGEPSWRRLGGRLLRGALTLKLVALVLLLLASSAKDKDRASVPFVQGTRLSGQVLARAGINTTLLMAQTDEPMPDVRSFAVSYEDNWRACPKLNCSTDEGCSAFNRTCCAHLYLRTMAFWDLFMHSQGLGSDYMLAYDTLLDALKYKTLPVNNTLIDLGISARAITHLEQLPVKRELWKHGYWLFWEGHTWRMCPHAWHPSPVFQRLMDKRGSSDFQAPLRDALVEGGYVSFHLMWRLPTEESDALQRISDAHATPSDQPAPPSDQPAQDTGEAAPASGEAAAAGAGAAAVAALSAAAVRAFNASGALDRVERQLPPWLVKYAYGRSTEVFHLCPDETTVTMHRHRHASIAGLQFPIPDRSEELLAETYWPNWRRGGADDEQEPAASKGDRDLDVLAAGVQDHGDPWLAVNKATPNCLARALELSELVAQRTLDELAMLHDAPDSPERQ